MSERTRLIRPITGEALPEILRDTVSGLVPGFELRKIFSGDYKAQYESLGVTIRIAREEHSYAESDEPWWPAHHWWECYVKGIPGIHKFCLSTGASSPGADEVYNFYSVTGEEKATHALETALRKAQLTRLTKGIKVVHSTLMPKAWQDFFMKKRDLALTGSFDWLKEYNLAQGEDIAPLVFECEGTNWLATTEAGEVFIRGPIPADRETKKETRQRSAKGGEPYGLELVQKLLPREIGWREAFAETTDSCFLSTVWGDEIKTRAWQSENWFMRQSVGGNKWGGMRSVYWLQPIDLAEAARFSLLAMFEIWGGGASLSFSKNQTNTQYFYTVVGGINPSEKAGFLTHLDKLLHAEGWRKE